MDEGVRSALADSSRSGLPGAAAQRLLTEARLGQVPAAAMTHREGETAEHLELVVDGLVRALVTAPGRSHDDPPVLPVRGAHPRGIDVRLQLSPASRHPGDDAGSAAVFPSRRARVIQTLRELTGAG